MILTSIWPTTVEGWIGLVSLIVGLIGAIAALIPVAIKLFKALKEIVKNKNWSKIKDIAKAAMTTVEDYHKSHPGMSSDDKLNMALDIIQAGCKEIGVEIDDATLENLVNYIKQTINWFNGMK